MLEREAGEGSATPTAWQLVLAGIGIGWTLAVATLIVVLAIMAAAGVRWTVP